MKVLISLLIIVVSIIGITDAGLITYDELARVIPQCAPGFDCGKVLDSQWSHIGPVPLSALGLAYYITVFSLGILNYLEIKKLPLLDLKPATALWLATSAGLLFSLYLVFLMGVVIKAWCFYCLISTASSTTLFILTTLLNKLRSQRDEPNPIASN